MTRVEVLAAAREALRAAKWARRAGWRPITALYIRDAARWRATAQMMRRCGMPCLPAGMSVRTAVMPPF